MSRWTPPTDRQSFAALPHRAGKCEARPELQACIKEGLFEQKRPPDPEDWLNGPGVKDRAGQTFAQWDAGRWRRPAKGDVIRLVPLGDIPESALDTAWLAECVRRFFGGMEVEMLEPVPSAKIESLCKNRQSRGFGTQLWTQDIHSFLNSVKGRRGKVNAFVTMAFTLFDLYPREEWNFVFGQAQMQNGTGVFSFARYGHCDPHQFRLRCAKVLCHELGHLFGLKHCVWHECLMGGSNGDWESDRNPIHLCPVDLAKLDASLGGIDLAAREAALEEFWRASGVEEEAQWCQRCGEAMSGVATFAVPRRGPSAQPAGLRGMPRRPGAIMDRRTPTPSSSMTRVR